MARPLLAGVLIACGIPGVAWSQSSPVVRHVEAPTDDPVALELAFQESVVNLIQDRPEPLPDATQTESCPTAELLANGLLLLSAGEPAQALACLRRVQERPDAPPEAAALAHIARVVATRDRERIRALFQETQHQGLQDILVAALNAQTQRQGNRPTPVLQQASYAAQDGATADAYTTTGVTPPLLDRGRRARYSQATVEGRPWNLSLLLGNEYDSNVGAFPSFEGLGSVDDKDDNRLILATFGDLLLMERDTWNLGLIGSVFSNFHYEQDDFNLQDYMGGAYFNKVLSDHVFAGVNYQFHEARLGGRHLASDHRLVPNLSVMYDGGHTTVYYEFDTAASNAPALIPAQFQSGSVNAVGLTQALYTFDGDGRVYFGYRFEDVEADGDDFDRATQMATARMEIPWSCAWIGDAEVRQFWDDYDDPNSLDFQGRPRYDTRVEVRAGLQKNFPSKVSLRLDYTFITTNSNVANLFGVNFFEYDRHILSTQFIYNF